MYEQRVHKCPYNTMNTIKCCLLKISTEMDFKLVLCLNECSKND